MLVVHTSVPWQISGNLMPMYFVNVSYFSLSLTGGSLQPCLPRPQPFRDSRGKVWLPEAVWSYKGLCVYKCLWATRICYHFISFFSWQVVTRNLNKIIDVNHYPVPEVPIIVSSLLPLQRQKDLVEFEQVLFPLFPHQAEYSNKRHRPIGIGVQGLADAFILMRYPFESTEAQDLNKKIFETIYFGALTASCELAKRDGPYETYVGSPVSKGVSALATTSQIFT